MYLDIKVLILSNKVNKLWLVNLFYLHVCDRKLVIIDIDQNTIFSLYKAFLLCEIRKKTAKRIKCFYTYLKRSFVMETLSFLNDLSFFSLMVFNATFNNIPVISWRSVLLVEETWRTRRKPPTWRMSLTNFITQHRRKPPTWRMSLTNFITQHRRKPPTWRMSLTNFITQLCCTPHLYRDWYE